MMADGSMFQRRDIGTSTRGAPLIAMPMSGSRESLPPDNVDTAEQLNIGLVVDKRSVHNNRSNLDLTAPGAIMRQSMEGFDMEHNGRCV